MDNHPNFAYSLVETAPSPATSGTSLVVTTGDGALFSEYPFYAVIWPADSLPLSTNAEIVRITNRSGNTLTITREQEGTTARSITVGDQIAVTLTRKTMEDTEVYVNASAPSNPTTGKLWLDTDAEVGSDFKPALLMMGN